MKAMLLRAQIIYVFATPVNESACVWRAVKETHAPCSTLHLFVRDCIYQSTPPPAEI